MPGQFLLETALGGIEAVINRILRLGAPDALNALARLTGQAVEIEFTDLGLRVIVLFGRRGISLSRQAPSRVSTRLRGTSLALARLGSGTAGMPEDVQIEGDVELAQRLRHLLETLEIDWEAVVAEACGDTLAHALVHHLERARGHARKASERLREDLSDYLLEELAIVPHADEVAEFIDAVDELRSAVDRCQARIAHIERRIGPDDSG